MGADVCPQDIALQIPRNPCYTLRTSCMKVFGFVHVPPCMQIQELIRGKDLCRVLVRK